MIARNRRNRAFARVTVAVVLLVGCLGLVAIAAPNAAAAEASEPVSTYADGDGTLTVLYENGTTQSLGVSPNVIGPMEDIDGDGTLEVVYIDQSNDLHAAGLDGSSQTLVSNNATGDYIAVGDWNGDGTLAVYYEGSNNGKLWRVEAGGTQEAIRDPDGNKIATNSPVGVADYDGDGDRDLLYLGSSSTLKYYDGKTINSTGFSGFGSNNGLGIGEPATFEDRGVRVPYVTSNNLALLAADGGKETLNGNYQKAAKAPVAATDWNGDGTHELMHVNTDNHEIYVGYLNGSVDPVTNASGSTLTTTAGLGILPGATRPAPTISEYAVTNPEGREVRVSFNSSDQLTDIEIDVSGAESATLTEADTTESGSGPYQYVATYQGSVDGDYTATLVRAANSDGVDGASDERGTVTVDTPSPTVDSATLTDATDGDGLVTDGDSVRVEATIVTESPISSVTADASAFGADSVDLAHESGSTYAGTFTVDEAGVGHRDQRVRSYRYERLGCGLRRYDAARRLRRPQRDRRGGHQGHLQRSRNPRQLRGRRLRVGLRRRGDGHWRHRDERLRGAGDLHRRADRRGRGRTDGDRFPDAGGHRRQRNHQRHLGRRYDYRDRGRPHLRGTGHRDGD
jgi:hypothetical protein